MFSKKWWLWLFYVGTVSAVGGPAASHFFDFDQSVRRITEAFRSIHLKVLYIQRCESHIYTIFHRHIWTFLCRFIFYTQRMLHSTLALLQTANCKHAFFANHDDEEVTKHHMHQRGGVNVRRHRIPADALQNTNSTSTFVIFLSLHRQGLRR